MRSAWAATAILTLTTASACRVATVRRLDERAGPAQTASSAEGSFEAAAFVDSIWTTEVLRALEAAQDVAPLTRPDATSASGSGRCIVVKGRGRVVDVDTRSRSGTAAVEVEGAAGSRIVLQIGPVLTGTAIRDALPALAFDRFVNQIQHADVGNELNARVERELLAKLDRARLRGRTVSFAGMGVLAAGRPLVVTPVRIEVGTRP